MCSSSLGVRFSVNVNLKVSEGNLRSKLNGLDNSWIQVLTFGTQGNVNAGGSKLAYVVSRDFDCRDSKLPEKAG